MTTKDKTTNINKPLPEDMATWLQYIEKLHPNTIAMGLDRVECLITCLQLYPKFLIINVAGTNGKGSTCAMLEQVYIQAGYNVGCYTSPHLLRYNERVRVNGVEITDNDLCAAFAAVETARLRMSGIPVQLTYFEIGTLAAIWHFKQTKIDIAILEIGLGGRLDAVNAFEPHCAIVTSVDLDHQEFLGNTRESIGREKAGVYRPLIPAICGDIDPPVSLVNYAKAINADFKQLQVDFCYKVFEQSWQYSTNDNVVYTLPLPALHGKYQLGNAACVVAAVESLQPKLPVPKTALVAAMQHVKLMGRFQIVTRRLRAKNLQVILDVAHNPQAARALAENLEAIKSKNGKTIAVFAMLADKDIYGVVEGISKEIDHWYIARIDHARGALTFDMESIIKKIVPTAQCKVFDKTANAYLQACIDGDETDKIVVFGSFYTVASVLQSIHYELVNK